MKNLKEPDMTIWNPTAPEARDAMDLTKLNEKIKTGVKREDTYEKKRTEV